MEIYRHLDADEQTMADAVMSVAVVILCITAVSPSVTSILVGLDACSGYHRFIRECEEKVLKKIASSFVEMVKHGSLKLTVVPENRLVSSVDVS